VQPLAHARVAVRLYMGSDGLGSDDNVSRDTGTCSGGFQGGAGSCDMCPGASGAAATGGWGPASRCGDGSGNLLVQLLTICDQQQHR